MAFINKKEEVIQIKLTQFGKTQLAKGRFRPHYYAFFDDDIIYDASHAGVVEDQNDIITRIKESPRLDLQHVTKGVELNYLTGSDLIEKGERDLYEPLDEFQETEERDRILNRILGSSHHGTQEAPYYTLDALGGAIIKNENLQVTFSTGSGESKIPQIEFRPEYVIFSDNRRKRDPIQDLETFVDLLSENIEFLDGTTLHIEKEDLVLGLTESNAPFIKDTFEYQLYEINKEQGEEKLVPIEDDGQLFEIRKDKKISNYEKHKKGLVKGFFNT